MPIYEFQPESLTPLQKVTFVSKKILEGDIQRIFRTFIDAIAPDTFVLAEEFSDWADSSRSIDLLCLDKSADLVVVELKRTTDGGHMELQAIRYAAMISKMTFADAVTAHAKFLTKHGKPGADAEAAILGFLGVDEIKESEFAQDVRIVLVSGDFSKEITTSVLWLNERELDIRCVRLHAYEYAGKTLVDIQQLLPLPEAIDYQVQLRRKASEERKTQSSGLDFTRYDLAVGSTTFINLYKRELFLRAIRAIVSRGIPVSELQQIIPTGKFLGIEGQLDGIEFRDRASKMKTPTGVAYDFRRFYVEDDDLFLSEGKTWALSNQWSIAFLPHLDQLIAKYPPAELSYTISVKPVGAA